MNNAKNDPGLSSAVSPDDPNSAIGGVLEAEAMLESEGRIRSGKLAGRTLRSAIWIVALPVLFQQSMAATVGLFDTMLTGSLPESMIVPALDAVGIGSYLNWLIGIAMSGLGIGGQAIIARAMGAGKRGEAEIALGQSLSFALLWGTIVAAAVLLLIDPLASIASLSPEATAYLHTYTRVIALSLPMCGILMVGSMCLYGAGETLVPAVIMIVVNLVNILASWLLSGADLVFKSFTITNPTSIDPETYGVLGIAAGTALAYLIGAVLIVLALARGVVDQECVEVAKDDIEPSGIAEQLQIKHAAPSYQPAPHVLK